MIDTLLIVLGVLIVLVGLLSLGFVLPPRPFRPHPAPSRPGAPLTLPADLPAPVRRHFQEMLGESVPEMQTAVIWGRGRALIRGVWLPLRFKSWYKVGEGFYTRMEITWFQRPVMRASESLRGGEGLRVTGGGEERGERVDQGNRMSMWANALWMPSALLYSPGTRWEGVDENSARFVYPAGREEDALLFHFDPLNGCATHITGRRYPPELSEKDPWRMDLLAWKVIHGINLPCHVSVSWGEAGSPTAYWNIDGVAYNVGVSDHL